MYMTEKVKAGLPAVVSWISLFPKELCFTIDDGPVGGAAFRVAIQAWTQEAAANVRALLPGLIWKKSYSEINDWWEYDTYSLALDCAVHIYAVREAPPTCRIERRTEMVEMEVPVKFEVKMVPTEVVEVHCDE